ncbi:hypothetical protein SAMN05661080_03966 [Modestobacter sp. DSM 44400]|nr:hypothetical protein SAMN05661080_03966 [Modestobacter sp. DSM 44400]
MFGRGRPECDYERENGKQTGGHLPQQVHRRAGAAEAGHAADARQAGGRRPAPGTACGR